jgi:hypothetical protein
MVHTVGLQNFIPTTVLADTRMDDLPSCDPENKLSFAMTQKLAEVVYKPIWFCIYCSDGRIKEATKRKLEAEHIIPFGLGGLQILPRSSCKKCATITGKFEGTVQRMMLGPTRIRMGLPTRRPDERPTELTLFLSEPNGSGSEERKIPAHEFPFVIPGLILPPPGILTGERRHNKIVGESWIGYADEKVTKIHLETGKAVRVATFNNLLFSQMLAKIAHAYAVAEWGFHSFRPLLLDLILNRTDTIAYWVGGSGPVKPADTTGLHRLELRREILLGTEYVVCYIRLFCNFGTPEYRVVVGTWNEGR